jgi:hypothetical protein
MYSGPKKSKLEVAGSILGSTPISQLYTMTFQVLKAANMKTRVFWDIAQCSLVGVDRRFRGAYCLHHPIHHYTAGAISQKKLISASDGCFYLHSLYLRSTLWRCYSENSNVRPRVRKTGNNLSGLTVTVLAYLKVKHYNLAKKLS